MGVREEMQAILEEDRLNRHRNVISRTLSKLISIEKEAMYGAKTTNKRNRIEQLINAEFLAYKESINAASDDKA